MKMYNYVWTELVSRSGVFNCAVISRESFTPTHDLYAHSHIIELEEKVTLAC